MCRRKIKSINLDFTSNDNFPYGHLFTLPFAIFVSQPMPMVEWNAPNLYYRLWYQKVPGPFKEPVRISDPTLGKFNIPDAGYYQEYQFKIQAGNDQGLGSESPLVRAFSGQNPPAGRPEDVTVGKVTARSVELSWKPVTVERGSVDGYRVSPTIPDN